MEEAQLPCKFIATWHIHPSPVGCLQTTIHHTYVHALQFAEVIPPMDKSGKLSDWLPKITEEPKEWENLRCGLTPNLTGQNIENVNILVKYFVDADPHI
eukprot:7369-Ditylum_brightwellii.AAC.1